MFDDKTAGRLIEFFERLLTFYREFFKVEEEKLLDLQTGRLDRLNDRMNQEQARVLKARGLEHERQRLLAETNAPDKKFSELVPLFPPELRERVQALHEELSSVLHGLKDKNRECNLLAQKKLARASVVLEHLQNEPELRKIYSDKRSGADDEAPAASLLSKKI